MAQAFILAQFEAFKHLNAQEPGQWSFGQTAPSWYAPREEANVETRVVEIELYQALPVPPDDVSLDDVLKFRERRLAERLAFREAMDGPYSKIINDRDIPRAKVAAVDSLERRLQELDRVVAETWSSRLLTNAKTLLSVESPTIDSVAKAIPTGVGLVASLDLDLIVGALITAATACLKFNVQKLRAPRLPESLKDFAYIYHLQRELR
jgi:hypothetical protein